MIDSCMKPKKSNVALAYGIHITLILKDCNVPFENEECDCTFMRFTSKTTSPFQTFKLHLLQKHQDLLIDT